MSEPTPDAILQVILDANRRGQLPSVDAIANAFGCSIQAVRGCCYALVETGKLRPWQPSIAAPQRSGVSSD